jgi:hypothetical protein
MMSPRRTRRFFLTTLLIRILASSTVSSDSTMHTVSLRFLPCSRTASHDHLDHLVTPREDAVARTMSRACSRTLGKSGKTAISMNHLYHKRTFRSTVSPLKSCSFSMVLGFSATTELSSLTASSTTSLLGLFLRSKMAVLKSLAFFLRSTGTASELCYAGCNSINSSPDHWHAHPSAPVSGSG